MITIELVPNDSKLLKIGIECSDGPTLEALITFLRRAQKFSQIIAPTVGSENQVVVAFHPNLDPEAELRELCRQILEEFGVIVDASASVNQPGANAPYRNELPADGPVDQGLRLGTAQIDQ